MSAGRASQFLLGPFAFFKQSELLLDFIQSLVGHPMEILDLGA